MDGYFGQGGSGTASSWATGGGGGYYGGGTGEYAGGGGGSGYIGGVTDGTMQNGVQTGHGKAQITLVSLN